jgi:MFS family permease
VHDRYKWTALTNATLGVTMASVNSSIVIISLPAIFRGIHLDPLAPGNVSYLLWLLMGYLLVAAVLVVSLGRLGDIYGRVRIFNAGFAVFSFGSVALAFDPFSGGSGGLWLILWRVVQGIGGAMISANAMAIVTDSFPSNERGMAVGIAQVASLSGQFLGLIAGGLLSEVDWRLVFFVSVPFGLVGTIWSYRGLREVGERRPARIDWAGNLTFAAGLTALLAGITYGIQPYGGHTMGWTSPRVLAGLLGGAALLVAFLVIETRVAVPMVSLSLFRIRAFWTAQVANLLAAISRGGLQFMLIIWLQGIWLPLHGYDFADTPLWAGIYLLPLTAGFLVAGPVAGRLSDRLGARAFTTGGLILMAASFVGMIGLPTDFPFWLFAVLIFLNGVGSGLFSAPNVTAAMNAVPAHQRGSAGGVNSTFMNSGMVLSIGICFSLMIVGLSGTLPGSLSAGLIHNGVPAATAHRVANLPPVGSLFAAFLGYNPIHQLLGADGTLASLPHSTAAAVTGSHFFPTVMSGPFRHGLVIVFLLAAALSLLGAFVSSLRPTRYVHGHAEIPGVDGAALADVVPVIPMVETEPSSPGPAG